MAELTGTAQLVADAVVGLYSRLPPSGKPRDDEYSVLAAVVAVTSDTTPHVLALGTGTKCIGRDIDNASGCFLSDSHAEVVARRAFVRFLCHEIYRSLVAPSAAARSPYIVLAEKQCEGSPAFELNPDYKLHMYVSDSPCGDAAVYETSLSNAEVAVVTGARPLDGCAESAGCLRIKSGRGDIAADVRTTSMSCSDKISRWCCLGLQGELLSPWMEPVYMTDLVVDPDELAVGDSQQVALRRAVQTRWHPTSGPIAMTQVECQPEATNIKPALDTPLPGTDRNEGSTPTAPPTVHIPAIHFLDRPAFSHGKARMKKLVPTDAVAAESVVRGVDGEGGTGGHPPGKRRKRNPLSPCGFSINWIAGAEETPECCDDREQDGSDIAPKKKTRKPKSLVAGGTVEVTVAHTGVLQGTTKDSVGTEGAASRLSRHCMRQLFEGLVRCCVGRGGQSELAARLVLTLQRGLQTSPEIRATREKPVAADCTTEHPLCIDLDTPASGSPPSASAASAGPVPSADEVLQAIHTASYRGLKKICGCRQYEHARADFLRHPVFKHWLCDDDCPL